MTEQEKMLRDIRNELSDHNKIMQKLSDRLFLAGVIIGSSLVGILFTLNFMRFGN
jgi:hypothetical protein